MPVRIPLAASIYVIGALGMVYLQGFLYIAFFPWSLGTAVSQSIKLLFSFSGLFAAATYIEFERDAPYSETRGTLVRLIGLTTMMRMFQHMFLAWRLWTLGKKKRDALICGAIYIPYFFSEVAFAIIVTNETPTTKGIIIGAILRSLLAILLLFYTTYRTSLILHQLEAQSKSNLVNTRGSLLKFHTFWNYIRAFIFFFDNLWTLFAWIPNFDATFDLVAAIFDVLIGYTVSFDPEFAHVSSESHKLDHKAVESNIKPALQYGPKITVTKNRYLYLSLVSSVLEITDQLPEVSDAQAVKGFHPSYQPSTGYQQPLQKPQMQNEQPNVV